MAETRVPLILPQLGNGVDDAVVEEWLVVVGDHVREHDPVVTIATDKATSELESPVTGVLAVVLAGVGAEVEVGAVLAEFEAAEGDR
jgi:pyruvate/2-oxoglutarate dehydrogenase complex dihydrolipoamide acyltransferase (E2) component